MLFTIIYIHYIRLMGIIVLIAAGWPMFLSPAIAENESSEMNASSFNLSHINQAIKENNNSGLMISQVSSDWQDIFDVLKQKEEEAPPENARSDDEEICLVSPGFTGSQVWYSEPLFIWQGSIEKIEFISRHTYEAVWTQANLSGQNRILYQGQPLEPGERYEVFIYYDANQPLRLAIEILDDESSQTIASELKTLEETLASSDSEIIAGARTNYFIGINLWSEAIKEIFLPENPSNELTTIRQNIIEMVCQPDGNDADDSESLMNQN
jgi:hypothetical protein